MYTLNPPATLLVLFCFLRNIFRRVHQKSEKDFKNLSPQFCIRCIKEFKKQKEVRNLDFYGSGLVWLEITFKRYSYFFVLEIIIRFLKKFNSIELMAKIYSDKNSRFKKKHIIHQKVFKIKTYFQHFLPIKSANPKMCKNE